MTHRHSVCFANSNGLVSPNSQTTQSTFVHHNLDVLLRSVERKKLYTEKTWLNLLQFKKSGMGAKSEVESDDFFLDKNGRRDPRAEMLATLTGFFEPIRLGTEDAHPLCRFPARYIWLNKQLNLDQLFSDSALKRPRCEQYLDWSQGGRVGSVSLILVSGYLGNPTSYFGHTLIKLNGAKLTGESDLLDQTINYGAISDENDSPLEFIVRSLIGAYQGGFTHIDYYYHTHNYGELQLRDMWEYELNFNKEETAFLVAHLWELVGKQHKYLFSNKNCASRMADVFSVVEGFSLLQGDEKWVMPQGIFMNLVKNEIAGRPAVRSIKYLPSRQTRLLDKLSQLDHKEYRVVSESIKKIETLDQPEFMQLKSLSRRRVLDTLLDYYNLKKSDDAEIKDQWEAAYAKVLRKRYLAPPGPSDFRTDEPAAPTTGRELSYIRLSAVDTEEKDRGLRLVFRPAYYDSLDGHTAHVPQSMLSMLKLEIEYNETGDFELKELELFAIESVNLPNERLPDAHRSSFRIRIAADRKDSLCEDDCITPHVSAAFGYSDFLYHNTSDSSTPL